MDNKLPELKHIYKNRSLNSHAWEYFKPRDDDIVIATPYKSGTTWMQNIVMHLVFQDLRPRVINDFSPWLDSNWTTPDEMIAQLEAQTYRRFIKTHLPLDGLRFFPQLKYIVVNRDGRDVFMSLWNHYRNLTSESIKRLDDASDEGFPPCPEAIREFWRIWTTRGTFAWENDGYPWWSCLHHVQTWWNFRDLPNILYVHYNDLLKDLEGEIRRIVAYLEMDIAEDILLKIVDAVDFKTMKKEADTIMGDMDFLEGGAQTFINKGTNGRWRDVLTEDDLKLYGAAVQRELTPDCAQWLENGRIVLSQS